MEKAREMLEGAEILAENVMIKMSHTGKREKAQVIAKSAFYGVFAVTRHGIRNVHRSNSLRISDWTWH